MRKYYVVIVQKKSGYERQIEITKGAYEFIDQLPHNPLSNSLALRLSTPNGLLCLHPPSLSMLHIKYEGESEE